MTSGEVCAQDDEKYARLGHNCWQQMRWICCRCFFLSSNGKGKVQKTHSTHITQHLSTLKHSSSSSSGAPAPDEASSAPVDNLHWMHCHCAPLLKLRNWIAAAAVVFECHCEHLHRRLHSQCVCAKCEFKYSQMGEWNGQMAKKQYSDGELNK